jgi:hypothetical protein
MRFLELLLLALLLAAFTMSGQSERMLEAILMKTTAPFTCAATAGGVYYDLDCQQWCVCGQTSLTWCRSDTGACGSATNCC